MQNNLQVRKQNFLNAILRNMDQRTFQNTLSNQSRSSDRCPDGREYLGFCSYQDFVNTQSLIVDNFDEGSLNTLELLFNQIIPISIHSEIPRSYTTKISGLCFDNERKIVFLSADY